MTALSHQSRLGVNVRGVTPAWAAASRAGVAPVVASTATAGPVGAAVGSAVPQAAIRLPSPIHAAAAATRGQVESCVCIGVVVSSW